MEENKNLKAAIEILKKGIDYAKFTENSIVTLDIDYAERLLLELTKQYESPTLEEVIKEWEEKGFEVENNSKKISFRSQKLNTDIYIDKVSKDVQICVCHYNYAQTISFELHQLLTKTFKALGCGGYND